MAVITTNLSCELQEAVRVQYLKGNLFSQDVQANKISVAVYDGGSPATISGTVTANIIREDGGTVTATGGTISGNVVSITLPAAAYIVPGLVSIVIKVTASSVTTTIAAVVVNVYQSSTETAIDPGTIIPSVTALVAQIEAAVASIPADYSSLWTSLAPAFSSSASYTPGQYVTNGGVLYVCTTSHTGSWNASHFSAVNVGGELSRVFGAINATQYMVGGYSIVFTTGGYISDNVSVGTAVTMTPTSNANYAYAVVSCTEGDQFTINGTGVSNALLWCFVDEDNKVLTKSALNATGTNLQIIAPANANKLILNTSVSGMGNCIKGQIIKDIVKSIGDKVETSHVITTADLVEQNPNFTISNGNITPISTARPFNSLLVKASKIEFDFARAGTGDPLYIGVAIGGHFVGNQTRTVVSNIREIYNQTNNEFTGATLNISTGDENYSNTPVHFIAEINQNVFTLTKENTVIFKFTVSGSYEVNGIAILNYNLSTIQNCIVVNNYAQDGINNVLQVANKADIIGLQTNHRLVAGVIRNAGSGWEFIINDHHQGDMNCVSVGISETDGRLYIDYGGINVKKVISLIAAPDEAFANQGYIIGASVGLDKAYIQIFQYEFPSVSAQIRANNDGTFTVESADGVTAAEWNSTNNALQITHNSIPTKVSGSAANVSIVPAFYGKYLPRIFSYASTSTKIEFFDTTTGTKVTTPGTGMSINFSRYGTQMLRSEIDPSTIVSANGNIWFIGIFEV